MSQETASPNVAGTPESSSSGILNPRTFGPIGGLICGTIVGGLMWLLLMQFEPSHPDRQPFSMPAEVAAKTEGYVVPPKEIQLELQYWERRVAIMNDVFFIGLFGLLLASSLGIAHGIYKKSPKAGLITALASGLIACAIGLGAGAAGHFAFKLLPEKTAWDPLVITIAAQGTMLALLGGGVGLAFALGTRGKYGFFNFVSFGVVSGILSAMAFAVFSSILTPNTDTFGAIPGSIGMGRLLWCVIVGVAVGALIPAAQFKKDSKRNKADAKNTSVVGAMSS